ncbi:hypothetical protein [Bradyrhizobium elkanii]|jgi:predicted transglutaminase-like cysteine proteinase|uniref:hypothetical protein n=1 Tax=Bradyrhizobium elkanii TaxID=29448 RepID=UPI002169A5C3|nr:hypothetical protein [Bradyrhizobium elkanii]MCS3474165.1 putative transglutaminase-like cysteine proteinase [Bradyrhizobium elkanii]
MIELQSTRRSPSNGLVLHSHPVDYASRETLRGDIILTPDVWADLRRANKCVNDTVKPISKAEHLGPN